MNTIARITATLAISTTAITAIQAEATLPYGPNTCAPGCVD